MTQRSDQRPPLALVHGWGLGSAVWEPLLPELARCWQVHLADLPGYRGIADDGADFDTTARTLIEALPNPITLCGWSLGGMLALRAALLAAERVRALVLVGTTASFVARSDWNEAQAPTLVDGFAEGIRRQPEQTLQRFIALLNRGDDKARTLTRQQLGYLRQDGQPSLATLARGLDWLHQVDLRALAPAVGAPCLLIHGANDPLNPLAAARQLANTIPHAQLEVFAGAGHAPFHHDGERFCRVLARFGDDLAR